MIKQTFFCDADEKEFNPHEGIGEIKGFIPKMNDKLEKQTYRFEGQYCVGCAELILNFLATLKDELATATDSVDKQPKDICAKEDTK